MVELAPSETEELATHLDLSEACAEDEHINCVVVHGSGPGECECSDTYHQGQLELRLAWAGTRRMDRSWWGQWLD